LVGAAAPEADEEATGSTIAIEDIDAIVSAASELVSLAGNGEPTEAFTNARRCCSWECRGEIADELWRFCSFECRQASIRGLQFVLDCGLMELLAEGGKASIHFTQLRELEGLPAASEGGTIETTSASPHDIAGDLVGATHPSLPLPTPMQAEEPSPKPSQAAGREGGTARACDVEYRSTARTCRARVIAAAIGPLATNLATASDALDDIGREVMESAALAGKCYASILSSVCGLADDQEAAMEESESFPSVSTTGMELEACASSFEPVRAAANIGNIISSSSC